MAVHETRNTHQAVRKLAPRLLDWFEQSARDLPWRRTRDPYAIWVSEIMLQQTQVKTVLPYWERWMRALPTIESVAKARPEKLHKLWEGLGYYTRVRNLQKAAQVIVHERNGKFPENFDEVLALPGIGRYTAGAICSIAFNQPTPILDGNVIRVLTRIFGITKNPRERKTNAHLWKLAEKLVITAGGQKVQRPEKKQPKPHPLLGERAGVRAKVQPSSENTCSALNQSLMELGALICTPRQPRCPLCPANKLCIAFRIGRPEDFPNPAGRPATTQRRFVAFVVERRGRFLVRQRPSGVVNAHLWEFPNVEIESRSSQPRRSARAAASELGFKFTDTEPLCTIKHSITRYRITLDAYRGSFQKSGFANSKTSECRGTPSPDPGRDVSPWRPGPARSRGRNPGAAERGAVGSASRPYRAQGFDARPVLQVKTLHESRGVWLKPSQLRKLAFTAAHKKILSRLKATSK